MNLDDPGLSYILISSEIVDDICSILWAKEYTVIPIDGFYRGNFEKSVLALPNDDNDALRKDAIFLLGIFNQESAIIKYLGETGAKKIFRDGSERPLGILMYNTDSENMSYLHNGISFSFVEMKRYWKPTKSTDIKKGMIVEYFNKNKWYQKEVLNPISEWEDMYKLLSKYDKVRIAAK
jgi:hypothetical protein